MTVLAALVLCQFGDDITQGVRPSSVVGDLIAQLGAGKEKGREAANRLARVGKPAVPALVAALRSKGANDNQTLMIRFYASAALSHIDDESAVRALYEALKDPKQHDWIKRNAAYAMGMASFAPAAPWLAKIARETSDMTLRFRCIVALTTLEDKEGDSYMREEGDDFLIEIIKTDPDPRVRIAAAKGLGDRRVAKAVDALATALSDGDHRVATNAARALAKLRGGGWRAVGSLIEALDRKEKVVRDNVRGALICVTGKHFRAEAQWKGWWKDHGRKIWEEKLKDESGARAPGEGE